MEAAVALAIVSIVCVAVLGSFGTAFRADFVATQRLPLAALAQERLAALDIYDGSFDMIPDSLARGNFNSPYGSAGWTAAAKRVGKVSDLYEVRIEVRDRGQVFILASRRHRASNISSRAIP